MTDQTIDDQARGLYEWDRRIALINHVRELETQRDAVLTYADDLAGGPTHRSTTADKIRELCGHQPPPPTTDTPHLTDLIGLDPDFTGGAAVDDYLHALRCGGDCADRVRELEHQRDAVLALCDRADVSLVELSGAGLWSMVETEELRAALGVQTGDEQP